MISSRRASLACAVAILALTAFAMPASQESGSTVVSDSVAAPTPGAPCFRCGESDPPVKHQFMDVGNWFKNGDMHSGWITGVCSTSTESPAHTQTGCDDDPCTENCLPCEPSCLAALESAITEQDFAAVKTLFAKHGRWLRYNSERQAVQVGSCPKQLIAHFPLSRGFAEAVGFE